MHIKYELAIIAAQQRIRWLDSITDSVDMNLGKPWDILRDREAWHAAWGCHKESDTNLRLNDELVSIIAIAFIIYLCLF